MTGHDLLPMIQANSRGERYSKNLMDWVQKHKKHNLVVAYSTKGNEAYNPEKTQASNIYIGIHDLDEGWLSGARLSEILCNGNKSDEFAHPPKHNFQVIPDWWKGYISNGKCHIDPEHALYADGERWQISDDGKTRKCVWCNNHDQFEHMEMVPYYSWRSF